MLTSGELGVGRSRNGILPDRVLLGWQMLLLRLLLLQFGLSLLLLKNRQQHGFPRDPLEPRSFSNPWCRAVPSMAKRPQGEHLFIPPTRNIGHQLLAVESAPAQLL